MKRLLWQEELDQVRGGTDACIGDRGCKHIVPYVKPIEGPHGDPPPGTDTMGDMALRVPPRERPTSIY